MGMGVKLEEYSNCADSELLAFLKDNDDRLAFETLYNRYWKKLLLQAERKLNSYSEAEEVLQNVFLDIWVRRSAIDINYSFFTYMSSAVKYQVFAQLAKRYKNDVIHTSEDEIPNVGINTTEEWFDYTESYSKLEQLIQQLPYKTKQVFRLSRMHGYSQKEISQELSISVKTVENHMTKALKLLRSSFYVFITLYFSK
ncbi:sigma-70 family RNA polymerase sigma factor [Plebeiibacterium sediminum]|uniref:Sigma-70 family RNA polymerase sigma factor n=1 Tax=Plebeiibacterium sediminum TaxID=2992112 RepID=A0AAE3M405_9BACT|nr:sigma-70 family RNA polymerase sigma factor [Plebeiobacterium sediminum]MCW3786429.1 sigma-70 family RNA polymerase sigma factor [Plebeiobacterium sediminum]